MFMTKKLDANAKNIFQILNLHHNNILKKSALFLNGYKVQIYLNIIQSF